MNDRHGGKARLLSVRPADPQEEAQYLRGEEPRNVFCPTGRPPHDRDRLMPPDERPPGEDPLSAG